jgi:hypothetical protein
MFLFWIYSHYCQCSRAEFKYTSFASLLSYRVSRGSHWCVSSYSMVCRHHYHHHYHNRHRYLWLPYSWRHKRHNCTLNPTHLVQEVLLMTCSRGHPLTDNRGCRAKRYNFMGLHVEQQVRCVPDIAATHSKLWNLDGTFCPPLMTCSDKAGIPDISECRLWLRMPILRPHLYV